MKQQIVLTNELQTKNFGRILGESAYPNLVFAFYGDLGAGKTTMTKGIAKGLGVPQNVNSPTFTIMKIYQGNLTLFHLDVYRVDNENSDFELEEYFDAGGVCVVEWAELIESLLPSETLRLSLQVLDEESRLLTIQSDSKSQKMTQLLELIQERIEKNDFSA